MIVHPAWWSSYSLHLRCCQGFPETANGSPLTSTNRAHMGTRRQKESRPTLEKNSGKREWIKNLGELELASAAEGQDSLEAENVQRNSPPGEWLNDDDDDDDDDYTD